jgi:hypothetical protein
MNMEGPKGPNLNPKREDDKKLARAMDHAGNEHRTIATKYKAWADEEENPRTLYGKLKKKLQGEPQTIDIARRLRRNAENAAEMARTREKNVEIIHDTREEVKDLSDEELETLIKHASWDLDDLPQAIANKEGVTEISMDKLIEEDNRLRIRLKTLKRILKERPAIRERAKQEKGAK